MIANYIDSALDQISLLRVADAVDILIVAVLVYFLLKFIRDSHTVRLLKGVILIIIAVQVVYFFNLHVTSYIITKCAQIGVIALVVIFQPELRRALEQVGKTSLNGWFSGDSSNDKMTSEMIDQVAAAAREMSETRTGALIVIERGSDINSLVSGGVVLDSMVSAELLKNLFVPNTPLHDGAVVIRENRITLAACVLPLSKNPNIATALGTRHRSGIGISEMADVVAVIVSEETGIISVAYKGELERDFDEETVKERLKELLEVNSESKAPAPLRNILERRKR